WAVDQRLWFAIKSSVPVKQFLVFDGDTPQTGNSVKGKEAKGVIVFDKSPGQVMLKVGISPVSSENALANIKAEIPG
ncbi:hypothetical protein, partial [Clostridium perfringens]